MVRRSLAVMTSFERLRLAALVTAFVPAAMLGFAYFSEYVQGLMPCILCLYQRPPHFVASAAGLLALVFLMRQPGIARAMLMLAFCALVIGAVIAGFHAGVEWKFWPGLAQCGGTIQPLPASPAELEAGLKTAKIVSCETPAWVFMGLSMAAWNALASAALALIALWGALRGGQRVRP